MNYGLYLAATGALTSMHRQEVLANNLANVNTVGFKPDRVELRERAPARVERPDRFIDPQWLLERLGGGHLAAPTRVDLTQGALVATEAPLDVAIDGPGFLVVAPRDATGAADHRLTRDGRLTLDAEGTLTTATDGLRVLDADGRPIRLQRDAPIRIDETGRIHQGGGVAATLQIVDAPAARLAKTGGNLLRLEDPGAVQPASGRVRQGYTEASAADPVLTLNALVTAARTAQTNLHMMQYHDQLLGQTFATFARVG